MPTLPNETIRAEKSELRSRFRAYRQSLPEEEYARRSTAIVDRIASLPELDGTRTVHVYWPMVERREIDTRPLIARLQDRGCTILLPVLTMPEQDRSVAGQSEPIPEQNRSISKQDPFSIQSVRYPGEDGLCTNRWGIAEPVGGVPFPTRSHRCRGDTPARRRGTNGHRIGYGLGCYDAFLVGLNALKIGGVYATCLLSSMSAESHDVAMDVLVTEESTLATSPDPRIGVTCKRSVRTSTTLEPYP